jgi:tetratricopeptide (TPR) repeat protein
MGAIQANRLGHLEEALKLFAEAAQFKSGDVDFSTDYAKTLGMAGAETNNEGLLKEAFSRFAQVHAQAPQHTLDLQNWAITYFYIGNYAEAWKKIELAEATPRRADLDPRFIAALQSKMPRP